MAAEASCLFMSQRTSVHLKQNLHKIVADHKNGRMQVMHKSLLSRFLMFKASNLVFSAFETLVLHPCTEINTFLRAPQSRRVSDGCIFCNSIGS